MTPGNRNHWPSVRACSLLSDNSLRSFALMLGLDRRCRLPDLLEDGSILYVGMCRRRLTLWLVLRCQEWIVESCGRA